MDPTQVIWRRIFAYAIDSLLIGLAGAVTFLALADWIDVNGPCPDPRPSGRICFTSDGDALLVNTSALVTAIVVPLVLAILDFVVLLGTTGRSVGQRVTV